MRLESVHVPVPGQVYKREGAVGSFERVEHHQDNDPRKRRQPQKKQDAATAEDNEATEATEAKASAKKTDEARLLDITA